MINTSCSEWWSYSRMSTSIQWKRERRYVEESPEWDDCERVIYSRDRENIFLVKDERRETISCDEYNVVRSRFITFYWCPRDTPRLNLCGSFVIWDGQISILCLRSRLELNKSMNDLLQLIRPCLYGNPSSQCRSHSVRRWRNTQNENRREIQKQEHSNLINLPDPIRRATQSIFSRNILHEHSRRNWDYASDICLMKIRTIDDDSWKLVSSVFSTFHRYWHLYTIYRLFPVEVFPFFSCAYPETDTAQMYNTHPVFCTYMDWTDLEFHFASTKARSVYRIILTTFIIVTKTRKSPKTWILIFFDGENFSY